MLNRTQVSVICPRNDLESATILDLAERFGAQCLPVKGDWGLTLEEALRQHPNIDALQADVITIELPGSMAAERLRATGRRLHIIDHHRSTEGGSASSLSSLEQFSALLGHTLSQKEYEIAIADRDWYPGLSRAGISWERAQELRDAEHSVRGATEFLKEARDFVESNKRQLGDITLFHAPARLENVLMEVAQEPTEEEYRKHADRYAPVSLPRVLALFHADSDPETVVGVRYAGPASARARLTSLLEDSILSADLKLWLGGGTHGCFFGASPRTAHPRASFNNLVSRLLCIVLGTDRPLVHYGCTFLLPLDLHEDVELAVDPAYQTTRYRDILDNKVATGDIQRHRVTLISPGDLQENQDEAALETQARLYFLPQLQDVLFEVENAVPTDLGRQHEGLRPIQHWRLPTDRISKMRWRLCGVNGDEDGPAALITDVSLYRYFNDLYIFVIQVIPEEASGKDAAVKLLDGDGDDWWRPLFESDPRAYAKIGRLRLDEWLRFTKHARILYPSYIEQKIEGKFDVQVLERPERQRRFSAGDAISPLIVDLLADFLVEDHTAESCQTEHLQRLLRLQSLHQDSMTVNCAYALAGPAPTDDSARADADRLFSLALYVDKASDTWADQSDYAYDRAFTRDLMQHEHRLDRWKGLGTQIGACPYANAYLGYGWFFTNVIAREHVPYHYQRMLIQALFYQLTLRNYNRRITHATHLLVKNSSPDPSQHFRNLRRQFIEFTNNYWFHEVTLTIQGREIFERQMKVLALDTEYGQIKEEMERADEYVQSIRDRSMNERMAAAGWIAGVLAVAALLATAFGFDSSWKHDWFWGGLTIVLALSGWVYWCRHRGDALKCNPRQLLTRASKAFLKLFSHPPAD